MRNIWIICRRETLQLLHLAHRVAAAHPCTASSSVSSSWNFVAEFIKQGMEMEMMGQASPMNINEQVIRPCLAPAAFLGLFVVPLISMRLFAEEKRNGTNRAARYFAPSADIEIILGKWFAATVLYCWIILYASISFVFLFRFGNPDWKPMLVTLLGVFLQGAALLAIGTFISTLTKNQIIAGALTFGACLLPLGFLLGQQL